MSTSINSSIFPWTHACAIYRGSNTSRGKLKKKLKRKQPMRNTADLTEKEHSTPFPSITEMWQYFVSLTDVGTLISGS